DPLGEDRQAAAGGQDAVTAVERLDVARRVDARVAGPVDRHRAGEIEQPPEPRNPPERALAEQAHLESERPDDEHRVDQPVDMVGHHDERPGGRQAIPADDLDPAEEDGEYEAAERADEAVEGAPHRVTRSSPA